MSEQQDAGEWRLEEANHDEHLVTVISNGHKTIWPWQLQKTVDILNAQSQELAALRAENTRLREERDTIQHQEIAAAQVEYNSLRDENTQLREALSYIANMTLLGGQYKGRIAHIRNAAIDAIIPKAKEEKG